MPLGDWATWVQSIATVAALIAAVVAAVEARRVYERESARDQQAEEDRRARAEDDRRAQANKVAAWYEMFTTLEEGVLTNEPPINERCAFVKNASDLPVYDVTVSFHVHESEAVGYVPQRGAWREVVPPHEKIRVGWDDTIGGDRNLMAPLACVVTIDFRDAAGNRWRRDVDGRLTDLSRNDPPSRSQNGLAADQTQFP